jgi:hypothetical protein
MFALCACGVDLHAKGDGIPCIRHTLLNPAFFQPMHFINTQVPDDELQSLLDRLRDLIKL